MKYVFNWEWSGENLGKFHFIPVNLWKPFTCGFKYIDITLQYDLLLNFRKSFISLGLKEDPDNIPGMLGAKQEDTPDVMSLIHSHLGINYQTLQHVFGRKPETLEETHTDRKRTCEIPHTQSQRRRSGSQMNFTFWILLNFTEYLQTKWRKCLFQYLISCLLLLVTSHTSTETRLLEHFGQRRRKKWPVTRGQYYSVTFNAGIRLHDILIFHNGLRVRFVTVP